MFQIILQKKSTISSLPYMNVVDHMRHVWCEKFVHSARRLAIHSYVCDCVHLT